MLERWVIRRRVFPRTGELAWRVSHPSLPQGRPLYGSVHLDSWQDALDYANRHAAALARPDLIGEPS